MVEVIFYTSENGREPVLENLEALPEPDQAKAAAHLGLLERYGASLREPHVKRMQDKLNELRFRISAGHYRVFFFFQVGSKAVLVHSIVKKTPTTPKSDLDLAMKRMRNWIRRYGG
jgi:phage-related protein